MRNAVPHLHIPGFAEGKIQRIDNTDSPFKNVQIMRKIAPFRSLDTCIYITPTDAGHARRIVRQTPETTFGRPTRT